jgi:transposase-like protein
MTNDKTIQPWEPPEDCPACGTLNPHRGLQWDCEYEPGHSKLRYSCTNCGYQIHREPKFKHEKDAKQLVKPTKLAKE